MLCFCNYIIITIRTIVQPHIALVWFSSNDVSFNMTPCMLLLRELDLSSQLNIERIHRRCSVEKVFREEHSRSPCGGGRFANRLGFEVINYSANTNLMKGRHRSESEDHRWRYVVCVWTSVNKTLDDRKETCPSHF